jgi:hypothetical protein
LKAIPLGTRPDAALLFSYALEAAALWNPTALLAELGQAIGVDGADAWGSAGDQRETLGISAHLSFSGSCLHHRLMWATGDRPS